MKRVIAGLLAHVDAGKTTLSEGLLYTAGAIKAPGRVDSGSAHLDTHALERERGITIFSAQAALSFGDTRLTLLDTPGHVDFSAEAERALAVLDYAILVVSGTDGVQAHTETLWRLLARRGIPVFIFVTKLDMPGCDKEAVMSRLKRLSPSCVDFSRPEYLEDVALEDGALLQNYLETGSVPKGDIARLIRERRIFPCCFGSGLKLTGIREFLQILDDFTLPQEYSGEFGARVYKISRDAQGNRLTWLKVTGGSLGVRMPITYLAANGEQTTEKIAQLRIYSGDRFEAADSVPPGCIAAALGLGQTWPGQALGCEGVEAPPFTEPVLSCRVLPPPGCDARQLLPRLRELEEEDPQLHILWNEQLREIQVQLMGQVQGQVLQRLIQDRFGLAITLGHGRILYRETITNAVEGVGHFEPLRHYAEVHLLLEPGAPGSGLAFASRCDTDSLDISWQRQILAQLSGRRHAGVLTGAPITDIRITLLSGRAHPKHTEGGDFRQAACRAVRQGLMQANSVLLEPYYDFTLELPTEYAGRALSDIRRMQGSAQPEAAGGDTRITGSAPVAAMRDYTMEVAAYTRGKGRLSCAVGRYAPCHDQNEIIAACGYDPERDVYNTPNSIFCTHGAGHTVKWDKVFEHMHLESALRPAREASAAPRAVSDRELEDILLRAVGPIKRPLYTPAAPQKAADAGISVPPVCNDVFIDGYNVIFAWEELKSLAAEDISAARSAFLDILCGYRAYHGYNVTVVFDAYLADHPGTELLEYRGLHVVYTAKEETADVYIAKALAGRKGFRARVVTSDRLIQLAALESDVLRTSAREFIAEVKAAEKHISEIIESNRRHGAASIAERIQKERDR